jgi:hypothetical protein
LSSETSNGESETFLPKFCMQIFSATRSAKQKCVNVLEKFGESISACCCERPPSLRFPHLRIHNILFVIVEAQSFHVKQCAKAPYGITDAVMRDYNNDIVHVSKVTFPEFSLHCFVNRLQSEMT